MATFIDFLDEVDALVLEYVMFRGFTSTFAAYQKDLKSDHTHKFNVQKIVDKVQQCISTHDYKALMELWNFLNFRFFCRLDGDFEPVVKRIEVSLKRYFIVTALAKGGRAQHDNVLAFLREECQGKSDEEDVQWRPWFALPFLPNPHNDPQFGTYFRKKWEDFFVSSFRNFLATVLQNIPLPKLLAFNLGRQEVERLEREVRSGEAERQRLEAKLKQLQLQLDIEKQHNKMLSLYRVDTLPQKPNAKAETQSIPVATVSSEQSGKKTETTISAFEADVPISTDTSKVPDTSRTIQTKTEVVEEQQPLVLGDEKPLPLGGPDFSQDEKPLPLGEDEQPLPLVVRRSSSAPLPKTLSGDRSPGSRSKSHQKRFQSGSSSEKTTQPASHSGETVQDSQPSRADAMPAQHTAQNSSTSTTAPTAATTATETSVATETAPSQVNQATRQHDPIEKAPCPFEVVSTVAIHGHSEPITQ